MTSSPSSSPPAVPGDDRRAGAAAALAARRRHVRRIRTRVAGASLATFLAATGAVLLQLATGHDPALARSASAARTPKATVPAAARHRAARPSRSLTPRVQPSAVVTGAS
jgi:hypothetical protein